MSITIKDDNDALDHSACQSVIAHYTLQKYATCIVWGNKTSTKELEYEKYVQRTSRQHKTS